MKKYIIAIIVCLVCLMSGKRLYEYYSWEKERTTDYTGKKPLSDDTLRVIMIGDSWAAYHQPHDTLLARMLQDKTHKPVSVKSSGMVGAKTKAIYELMFDSISPVGTRTLIKNHPDYCIISAGINDAVAKMGPENYVHHYSLILKQLIANNITPICIDMPDVDYKAVFMREALTMRIRHRLANMIIGTSPWSFEEYRDALKDKLSHNEFECVIYIDAKSWNKDGHKDSRHLYLPDKIHLNAKGYTLLDSAIVNAIEKDMSRAATSNDIQKSRNQFP